MVRRPSTHLGPKVLAGRMVREYVERLYAPAARAHRALTPRRGRATWPPGSPGSAPPGRRSPSTTSRRPRPPRTAELGTTLSLRVRVGLGDLAPDDVEVQAVSGRVDAEDRIADADVSR